MVRGTECTLHGASPSACPLQALEELWRGKENTFGLRLRHATSDVHFQSKSREVAVDQFHSALQIFGNVKNDATEEIDTIDQEEKREERLVLTKKLVRFIHCDLTTSELNFH